MSILIGIGHFLFILSLVVLIFNLLIIVHEWGHFLAARMRGLKVEKFQIWFGKRIWKKTINGVEYGLGTIPAGGFVALPQMAPMEMLEGKGEETEGEEKPEPLPPISPMDKIIVAAAGPLFSLLLAFAFALVVWVIGHPASKSKTETTIGYVMQGSPAEEAGLKPGDKVLKVDGQPVKAFVGMVDSIMWSVVRSEGETVDFEIERESKVVTVPVKPSRSIPGAVEKPKEEPKGWFGKFTSGFSGAFKRPPLRWVGIEAGNTPMVGKVMKNSPAEDAGIRKNDYVTHVDGKPIMHTAFVADYINGQPGKPITLTMRRDGKVIDKQVTPRIPDNKTDDKSARPMLGIQWDLVGETEIIHPNPITQVVDSVRTMVNTIGAVFSPKSEIGARHLSGPVGIMRIYYRLFEAPDGWRLALWFSVLLNVNLALLNLLPLPVLDGGHITLAILEGIRRKPVHIRVLEVVQTACALFLIGFMLYITVIDVLDPFGRSGAGKSEAPAFYSKEQRQQGTPATP